MKKTIIKVKNQLNNFFETNDLTYSEVFEIFFKFRKKKTYGTSRQF